MPLDDVVLVEVDDGVPVRLPVPVELGAPVWLPVLEGAALLVLVADAVTVLVAVLVNEHVADAVLLGVAMPVVELEKLDIVVPESEGAKVCGNVAVAVVEGVVLGAGEPVMEPEREPEGLVLELRAERLPVGVFACERVEVGLLSGALVRDGLGGVESQRQYSVKPSLVPGSRGATLCTVM